MPPFEAEENLKKNIDMLESTSCFWALILLNHSCLFYYHRGLIKLYLTFGFIAWIMNNDTEFWQLALALVWFLILVTRPENVPWSC